MFCKLCAADGIRNEEDIEDHYDGYGIYMGSTCEEHREEFLAKFRPDIKDRYKCNEPIEREE